MIRTRLANADDHAVCARLFGELGVPEPPPSAERFVAGVLPMALVATDGGEVVGYASWRLYGLTAHVVNVVTAPEARRRGVGRALVDAVRAEVAGAGCARWYLNVRRDNAAAIRLYQRSGMKIELESTTTRMPWDRVAALPAPAAPVTAFTPTTRNDTEVAARFDLTLERVTTQRTRGNYVPAALREAGEIVAFATFSPSFPGAYPFCALRPDLARPLLEALRPHAAPNRADFLYVTAEGDAPLARTLIDAGAEVLYELYRMGSPLE